MPPARSDAPAADALPGYYIRRLQQIAVAIFLEETEAFGVTPVQYAALRAVQGHPQLDQRTLARAIGFDTSTIGGVIDRLEARGLMRRELSPDDRRVRLLGVTAEGAALLKKIEPRVQTAQQRILAPLPPADRKRFMAMLQSLVASNNALSRAPSEAPGA